MIVGEVVFYKCIQMRLAVFHRYCTLAVRNYVAREIVNVVPATCDSFFLIDIVHVTGVTL